MSWEGLANSSEVLDLFATRQRELPSVPSPEVFCTLVCGGAGHWWVEHDGTMHVTCQDGSDPWRDRMAQATLAGVGQDFLQTGNRSLNWVHFQGGDRFLGLWDSSRTLSNKSNSLLTHCTIESFPLQLQTSNPRHTRSKSGDSRFQMAGPRGPRAASGDLPGRHSDLGRRVDRDDGSGGGAAAPGHGVGAPRGGGTWEGGRVWKVTRKGGRDANRQISWLRKKWMGKR